MALVASPNSHNLPFSSNTFDWPRLNELYAYQDTTPRNLSILASNSNYENPSTNSSEVQLLPTSNKVQDCSKSGEHFSGKQNDNFSIDKIKDVSDPSKTDVNKDTECTSSVSDVEHTSDSPNDASTKEFHGRLALPESADARSDFLSEMSLSNNTESSENEYLACSSEDNDFENTEASVNICYKKKKRLKKIRQKSIRKWKTIDCADLGFHISNISRFPHEEEMFCKDNTNDDTCTVDEAPLTEAAQSEASQSESPQIEAHESASQNDTEILGTGDIAQNELDDIAFFRALGVDVLNFDCNDDENADILFWDGVYFPKKKRSSQPLMKTEKCDKSKIKSKIKPNLTANGQTGTSMSARAKPIDTIETDNVHASSHSLAVFSRIKKYDRFRLFELECSSSKRIYIRRDRDRRKEKAHKAVKSKNCPFVLSNIGRKRMYMHHRLIKMHNLDLDFRGSIKSYSNHAMTKTSVALDVAKVAFRANSKATAVDRPAPVQNLHHALHEANCTGHLEGDLASFLITLQHRDLTPEDYDMLLRLDDTVKPKTASDSVLENLRTETIGPDGPEQGSSDWEPMCTICMEPYVMGQRRKFLPCGHDFHAMCVDKWLKSSSLNCPLDGLSIEPS